jgi:archaetidylinositol phosphate synthase
VRYNAFVVLDKAKLRSAIKKKDGWWASIFSGPLANRLLEPICEIKWISPNLITISSLIVGLIASYFFYRGSHLDLIIGAFLVQLSFVVDCMDGQLARYRQQFSKLGAWLDRIADRVKDFFYFFSLAIGYYLHGAESQAWTVFPIAMIAMFSVFLIDYYVNQDMKLEPELPLQEASSEGEDKSVRAKRSNPLHLILKLGLKVYQAVPVLRFNIGEQALLLSLFTAFNQVYIGISFFAALGVFYCFYWPVAKLYGFTSEK